MNDAEKVKAGLECCGNPSSCEVCPYVDSLGISCIEDCCQDTLKLIRKLEQEIKERPKVVLCKNCKYASKSLSPYPEYGRWCNKNDQYVSAEFYCGYGKVNENDG